MKDLLALDDINIENIECKAFLSSHHNRRSEYRNGSGPVCPPAHTIFSSPSCPDDFTVARAAHRVVRQSHPHSLFRHRRRSIICTAGPAPPRTPLTHAPSAAPAEHHTPPSRAPPRLVPPAPPAQDHNRQRTSEHRQHGPLVPPRAHRGHRA